MILLSSNLFKHTDVWLIIIIGTHLLGVFVTASRARKNEPRLTSDNGFVFPLLIYICLHSFTFIYIHLHSFTFIYIHLHSFTFIYIHLHSFTFIYIHLHSSTFIYIYLHSGLHTTISMLRMVFNKPTAAISKLRQFRNPSFTCVFRKRHQKPVVPSIWCLCQGK